MKRLVLEAVTVVAILVVAAIFIPPHQVCDPHSALPWMRCD